MKSDSPKIVAAVSGLSEVMIGFPKSPIGIAVIAQEIASMVATDEELFWLTATIIRHVTKWPGVAQVRALFATQFTPADGQPGSTCEIPGFRPEDFENRFFKRESEDNEKRMAQYRADRAIAPPEDREPLALPDLAKIKSVPRLPPAKPRLCRHCKLTSHPETFIDNLCPKCGQESKPMTVRETEETLGIRPRPEQPTDTVN